VIWKRAKRFCVRCGHVPTDVIQRGAAHGGFSLAAARLNSYGKSSYLTALSDAAIEVCRFLCARPIDATVIVLELNGEQRLCLLSRTLRDLRQLGVSTLR
jgi:hypothetical protein